MKSSMSKVRTSKKLSSLEFLGQLLLSYLSADLIPPYLVSTDGQV